MRPTGRAPRAQDGARQDGARRGDLRVRSRRPAARRSPDTPKIALAARAPPAVKRSRWAPGLVLLCDRRGVWRRRPCRRLVCRRLGGAPWVLHEHHLLGALPRHARAARRRDPRLAASRALPLRPLRSLWPVCHLVHLHDLLQHVHAGPRRALCDGDAVRLRGWAGGGRGDEGPLRARLIRLPRGLLARAPRSHGRHVRRRHHRRGPRQLCAALHRPRRHRRRAALLAAQRRRPRTHGRGGRRRAAATARRRRPLARVGPQARTRLC